ncbi:MAG TPA: hypothetical protein VGG28_21845 [Kofleriaceae bacterium]|jgi:hypothetical protein
MTEQAALLLEELRHTLDVVGDDSRLYVEFVLHRVDDQHFVCDIANDFAPSGFDLACQFTTLALLDRCWNVTDIEGLPAVVWSPFRASVDALKPS